MSTVALDQIIWQQLARVADLGPIRDEKHYDHMVALMNAVLDETRGAAAHPLNGLLDVLTRWIEDYEQAHYPPAPVSPPEILRFLMEQHGLTQSDLPEVGSQGQISELLSGRRQLNARQIKALRARFGVPADVFLGG
jgi:HTH-type transcriptional regulator / antitoxin HigA